MGKKYSRKKKKSLKQRETLPKIEQNTTQDIEELLKSVKDLQLELGIFDFSDED